MLSPGRLDDICFSHPLTFMGVPAQNIIPFECELDTRAVFQTSTGSITGSIKFSFVCLLCYICSRLGLLEISKIPYLDCWQ